MDKFPPLFQENKTTSTHLLHRDTGFPRLFLIQDRQTDRAGGIDVGMEQGRVEFAWLVSDSGHIKTSRRKGDPHFGGFEG